MDVIDINGDSKYLITNHKKQMLCCEGAKKQIDYELTMPFSKQEKEIS